jgi:hypothetical protein
MSRRSSSTRITIFKMIGWPLKVQTLFSRVAPAACISSLMMPVAKSGSKRMLRVITDSKTVSSS